jgi:L-alanine-DL-glutamate epimerase-like enolase superfamily enzyme
MIQKIHIYQLRIPFQLQITHNLASRSTGESIVAVVEDDSGILGYGEGTPREYVTGESVSASCAAAEALASQSLEINCKTISDITTALKQVGSTELAQKHPAAWCAIEMASFDLYSKRSNLSLWELFEQKPIRNTFEYSAVLPMMQATAQEAILNLIAQNKIKHIKIKIDDIDSGVSRVKQARDILGGEVNIRVDANAAFSSSEALDFLKKVEPYSISAIEQPVAKKSLSGLQKITENSNGVLVIADESLCTIQDAKELINSNACHVFNMRLSKCGGFLNCIDLYKLATKNGMRYQIGCHVGESSILSAAGRSLATLCPNPIFLEGSFSKYMLLDDVIEEDISFGPSGYAEMLPGPGLGINLSHAKLEKWAVLKKSIKVHE